SSSRRTDPLRVAITGSHGLIGGALDSALRLRGDEPVAVPRDMPEIRGADAVVHLAGAPIAVRWAGRRKREILESRVLGTRRIVEAIAREPRPPRVLV